MAKTIEPTLQFLV